MMQMAEDSSSLGEAAAWLVWHGHEHVHNRPKCSHSSHNTIQMPPPQNLPIELIRRIILNLEHPRDLLHIALTCKFFHEMIIVTRHLHLTRTNCSDPDTPLRFWRTLYSKPHYASMIRRLELRSSSCYNWYKPCGRMVDAKFADDLISCSPLPDSPSLVPREFILKSLDYMDGLKGFGINNGGIEKSIQVCDYLPHLSKNSLEAPPH